PAARGRFHRRAESGGPAAYDDEIVAFAGAQAFEVGVALQGGFHDEEVVVWSVGEAHPVFASASKRPSSPMSLTMMSGCQGEASASARVASPLSTSTPSTPLARASAMSVERRSPTMASSFTCKP